MRINRRKFLNTTLLGPLVGAALVGGRGGNAFAQGEPIRIGGLHDLSGANAASGIPMLASLNIAIEEVNSRGGLLGRPVELIHYDTQSSIQMYSQYAQQLALRDEVAVVFGGITSASREAIRPVFNRYKLLYFYATQYEGGVCDRNTFCTGTTPAQTVEKLVPYAMNLWGKKVYIIAADYNYGQITAKWMAKYVTENGGEVLGAEFFPLDVTNFGPTISKIQSTSPDLILSALVGGNHISFYRQWTAAGMKVKIPIASSTFGIISEQQVLDAAEGNGVLASFGYFEELPTEASKTFVEKVKAKYPDVPYLSELAAATYEGFHFWSSGVQTAGTVDRDAVIAALEKGVKFDGPSGEVELDPVTHHVTRNTYVAEAKDQKFSVLETFYKQKPLDTAAVCDLVKNPNDNKQHVIEF